MQQLESDHRSDGPGAQVPELLDLSASSWSKTSGHKDPCVHEASNWSKCKCVSECEHS